MNLGVSMDELIYEKSVASSESHWSLGDGRTLHILHFNDVYNLDPAVTTEPIGGAARFATLMDYVQRDLLTTYGCHPLIVFSGDFVGPSLMSTITKGAHMIEMLNLLGVHCATFGNHELDYGYDNLIKILDGDGVHPASNVQWVASNMRTKDGRPIGKAHKTLLFDWNGSVHGRKKQSIRVGVLAVSEDWITGCSTVNAGDFQYVDFIEAARETAKALRLRGAEIVLAITHSRHANDIKLSDAVPEIDLILGGHDHEYIDNIKDKRIIKSGEEWKWLSHITVSTGDDKNLTCKRYYTRGSIPPSPGVEVLCELYRHECEEKYSSVIYKIGVDMDPREECVRFGESLLANWICDACLWYFEKVEKGAVDVCVLPASCFSGKSVFPKGDFTLGNLMTVLSRGVVEMVIVRMKSDDLKMLLTYGAKTLPNESSHLMHVSKKFQYTVRDGIVDIRSISKKTYGIAMPASLMNKKELNFSDLKIIQEHEKVKVLSEIIIQYCLANLSIYTGKKDDDGKLIPLLSKYVDDALKNGHKNNLCPAKPSKDRIVYVKSSSSRT
jgi:5'-nucleotidase